MLRLAARAFPPLLAPSLDRATACGFLVDSGSGTGGDSSVLISTMSFASWLKSRGAFFGFFMRVVYPIGGPAAPGPEAIRFQIDPLPDIPLSEAVIKDLAATLKNKCGTGGTVKDGRIEIQGDQRERIIAELERLGYSVKRVGG